MTIVSVDPRTNPLWNTLVEQVSYSSVFNSPGWIRVLSDTYGWTPSALIATGEDGQPQAGLAYFAIEDMLGKRIVALPFSDFSDPMGEDEQLWSQLCDQMAEMGAPIALRCLHNEVLLSGEFFSESKKARWHGIDLKPDTDTLWGNLHRTARQCIQKAEREGVTIRLAETKDDLRAFFNMHLRVRKYKYHMVAQPYRFFEAIWENFIETNQGMLLLATCEETIIGGGFFLIWKDGLYYKFNTSDPCALCHRPNDLILWQSIVRSKERGCQFLDYGLCDWDQAGLARYKRKFGAYEKTIHFLRYTPVNPCPIDEHAQQIRQLLPQLTDLFTDESVPDEVTENAGALLYRFFT